jgi:hypothetical protein
MERRGLEDTMPQAGSARRAVSNEVDVAASHGEWHAESQGEQCLCSALSLARCANSRISSP